MERLTGPSTLFYFFLLLSANAQWVLDDEVCYTPNKQKGTCILLKKCKPIWDILDKAPQPLDRETIELLRSYQCGFEGNSPKVCCPPNTNQGENQSQPPDVSKHRNLRLLPKSCGSLDTVDRIINGNKTGIFDYPWMALLSYKTARGPVFKCGATIINKRYILTAAHCIVNLDEEPLLGVRVGEHNIYTQTDCESDPYQGKVCAPMYQDLTIKEIIPHPEYDRVQYGNDIGLLRVSRIDLSQDNAKPICLPLDKARNYDITGKNGIVTGWGTTETANQSPDLLQAEIPVVPHEQCRQRYKNVAPITLRQFCAGGKNKIDSCTGDSGGPLQTAFYLHGDTRMIQLGIVSIGPKPCAMDNFPGVYTKIAYYMDWILDNMKR